MINKINLTEKFALFTDYWSPKILAECNENYLKVAKFKGEFIWHKHDNEDELFLVIKGKLCIRLRDQDIHLEPGECVVIPKGTEHMPVAEEEVEVLLIEPKATINTGDADSALQVRVLDRL
jgi:mannose-6-phosphate isomerase-like protein (cupin superfamily)